MKTLDRVRQIRNAAAHNNCFLNDLRPDYDENGRLECSEPIYITRFVRAAGISKSSMRKKLSNRRFSQIVHLVYTYNIIVSSTNSRSDRIKELNDLVKNRMIKNREYFSSNQLLSSTYQVLEKIVDNLQ